MVYWCIRCVSICPDVSGCVRICLGSVCTVFLSSFSDVIPWMRSSSRPRCCWRTYFLTLHSLSSLWCHTEVHLHGTCYWIPLVVCGLSRYAFPIQSLSGDAFLWSSPMVHSPTLVYCPLYSTFSWCHSHWRSRLCSSGPLTCDCLTPASYTCYFCSVKIKQKPDRITRSDFDKPAELCTRISQKKMPTADVFFF